MINYERMEKIRKSRERRRRKRYTDPLFELLQFFGYLFIAVVIGFGVWWWPYFF